MLFCCASTVDFLVRVVEGPNNGNPPITTHDNNPLISAMGIFGVVPKTSRRNPLNIKCGTSDFYMEAPTSTPAAPVYLYDQKYIRIGFKDLDDARQPCQLSGNDISLIRPATFLPKGVDTTSGTLQREIQTQAPGTKVNPTGTGYIDVKWEPQCEDPSQLGVIMLCFEALDKQASYGGNTDQTLHKALFSAPSPVRYKTSMESENPSCVWVYIIPPGDNPAPVISAPSQDVLCSGDCCACCGQDECACDSPASNCCPNRFGTAGIIFRYTVRAVDQDLDTQVQISFQFPSISILPTISSYKYGCGGLPFDTCISDELRPAPTGLKNDATLDLIWDLTPLGEFSCTPALGNATYKPLKRSCAGDSDVTTCGRVDTGATKCAKAQTPAPGKVCFTSGEVVAESVDKALWKRIYGQSPGAESCRTCFVLGVADRPFFVNPPTLPTNTYIKAAVGKELQLEIMCAATVRSPVSIALIANPGAPMYSILTPTETTPFAAVFHNTAYRRKFVWTPQVGQHGTDVSVCFQATAMVTQNGVSEAKRSDVWCYNIQVEAIVVSWKGTSPCPTSSPSHSCSPQGLIKQAAAGCTVTLDLVLSAPEYALTVAPQRYPDCPSCIEGGISVRPCGQSADSSANGESCCGNGQCDGAETGANCAEDCAADHFTLMSLQEGTALNSYTTKAQFSWIPARSTSGRTLLQCLAAGSPPFGASLISSLRTAESGPSFCLVLQVRRCAYCVPAASSLHELARHEFQNADWLRLYNSNPRLPDPDEIRVQEEVKLGPIYQVQPGDTIISVAAAAKTTVKQILENNADLYHVDSLVEGQALCLMLCSSAIAQ